MVSGLEAEQGREANRVEVVSRGRCNGEGEQMAPLSQHLMEAEKKVHPTDRPGTDYNTLFP